MSHSGLVHPPAGVGMFINDRAQQMEVEREMSKQHTVRAEKSGGVEQTERIAQRRENREYKVSIGKSLCILRYFCIW